MGQGIRKKDIQRLSKKTEESAKPDWNLAVLGLGVSGVIVARVVLALGVRDRGSVVLSALRRIAPYPFGEPCSPTVGEPPSPFARRSRRWRRSNSPKGLLLSSSSAQLGAQNARAKLGTRLCSYVNVLRPAPRHAERAYGGERLVSRSGHKMPERCSGPGFVHA